MRRPRTIAEMKTALKGFGTSEGFTKGLAFKPLKTDIIISPFAKCGTTWMQQIVHGLRSNGAMEFDEITEVVPWIEVAHDMGVDIEAPQVASPRAFKSHLPWDTIPKGAKYIIVLRDPLDAFFSFYRFFEGWLFEKGCISLGDFADYYLDRETKGKGYWQHCGSFWRQRDNPNVLLLTFEDMKADLPKSVKKVSDFMGIDDPSTIDTATRQASYTFMKEHGEQFDDHLIRQAFDAPSGLPPGGTATKVDKGQTGRGKDLITDDIRAKFDAMWQAVMTQEFGLANYAALRRALHEGFAH